jgi:4-nitrophenyl phosphatase
MCINLGGLVLDLARFNAVLFDMDGVLYRGIEPLPGVNELLTLFDERNIRYACVTNNAMLTPEQYEAKLAKMGIRMPAANVVTSPIATRAYLETQAPRGTRAFYVGMEGLYQALFADGYFVYDEVQPEYVVVGMDRGLSYDKLATATLAIRAGARFIGTNADRTLPTERGLLPGAGSLLALLQTATDVEPFVIGKPAPAMITAAVELLGTTPDRALMIGDRIDTDIEAAIAANVASALVFTGVTTPEFLAESPIKADAAYTDLVELAAAWRAI